MLICCSFTLLPFPRTQRSSIRLAASATGTFGFIVSIALLTHAQSWSDVWERLWVTDGNGWGDGVERALSAGYWLVLIAGCLADWALRRYFGGNPDEVFFTWLTCNLIFDPVDGRRNGTRTSLNTPPLFLWPVIVQAFFSHFRPVPGTVSSPASVGQNHPMSLSSCSLRMISIHSPHACPSNTIVKRGNH